MSIYTLIGLAGVVLVLAAYALLSYGKLAARDVRYQWLNVAGTAGILISLIGQWNAAAFVSNTAWISIGLYSLARLYRARYKGEGL